MNVQLLLLLALVGPFCAFTHASPTVFPTDLDVGTTETVADVTSEGTEYVTDVTDPSATERTATPKEEAGTEEVTTEEVATEEVATEAVATEAATTEAVTEAAPPFVTVNTEDPFVETETAAAAAVPEPLITDPPAEETAAPTEQAETEVHPVATGAAEPETDEEVVVEDGTEEGLSSGQVVGIVIGALLAMVIVIAVVIAVVRRMGKYSSAKNKKPAKKDSVMVSPLRKKPAKQQERPKFWKF